MVTEFFYFFSVSYLLEFNSLEVSFASHDSFLTKETILTCPVLAYNWAHPAYCKCLKINFATSDAYWRPKIFLVYSLRELQKAKENITCESVIVKLDFFPTLIALYIILLLLPIIISFERKNYKYLLHKTCPKNTLDCDTFPCQYVLSLI